MLIEYLVLEILLLPSVSVWVGRGEMCLLP